MEPFVALKQVATVATGQLYLAQDRGGSPADLEGADPDAAIRSLLDSLPWLPPLLSAMGAVLAVYVVYKFLVDKNKGQAGGAGTRAGQVFGAGLGLALFFSPTLVATMFDWGLTVVETFLTWLGGVFATSD